MSTTKTITWNGVSSATIPELVIGKVTRSLLGLNRGTELVVPAYEGSYYFGNRRGRRRILAECHVEAASFAGRRTAITAVADWLDYAEEANLYLSDEVGVYYEAFLGTFPDVDEWREFGGPFELEWWVQPYSLDINTTTEHWISSSDEIHTWNPGLKTEVFPVIEIKPTNGTLTDFTLRTNAKDLRYIGTIADDATLTINSIVPTVITGASGDSELTGEYDPSLVSLGGVSGAFPTLVAGSNTIRFIKNSGTATTIDITVYYRKKYRR